MSCMKNRVRVRKLRRNLSVYLGRVPRLPPLREHSDVRGRLIAEGRLIPRLKDSRDLPPPVDDPGLRPTSEILDDVREDRR